MKIFYGIVLVLLILALGVPVLAQEHSGVITDAETGDPLIGANVLIEGTTTGAATDTDGNFSFEYSPPGDYTLVVTFVGYRTAELNLSPGDNVSNLSFELAVDPFGLDEIVVSGIASRTSKAVAEVAVTRIDMAEIVDKANYTDLMGMVIGKVSGVTIQAAHGQIGSPFRFQMRGGGGLHGNAQPIIVIDGVRTEQDYFWGEAGQYNLLGTISSLNFLAPEEIESIEILKGPAGAASYGTDGSNGVVVITTKKGQLSTGTGKDYSITYKGSLGWNDREREYDENDVRSYKALNDWFRKGKVQKNNINISGGTQRTRYYISADKSFVQAHIPQSSEDRSNYRVNIDAYPNEKFDVSVAVGYFENEIEANQGDEFWIHRGLRNPLTDYQDYPGQWIEEMRLNTEHIITNQITASVTAAYRPFLDRDNWLKGLSGRLVVGVNDRDDKNTYFRRPSEKFDELGRKGVTRGNMRDINYSADVRYEYNLWGIDASANVGTQLYDNRKDMFSGQNREFVTDLISDIEAGDVRRSISESNFHERKAGIFSEHTFSYDNTYFWSAMLRRDYVSVLKKGSAAIYYPRFSASVRLDRFDSVPESFGMLKLRTGYGETGILPGRTDAIPLLFGGSLSPYGVGAFVDDIGNPDIEPERLTEWEIGLEAEYRNFLSVDVTYFRTGASNSIYNVSAPPSTGISGDFNKNIAEIEGHGFESQVQVFFSGRQFGGWSFNLSNIAQWSTNKVVSLGEGDPYYRHSVWSIEEGYEKGYARPYKGVKAAYDENGIFESAIFSEEKLDWGHQWPPWTGSFSSNLSVGPFSAYALFEWKSNFWMMNDSLIDDTGPAPDGKGSVILYADRAREILQIPGMEFGLIPEEDELTPGTPEYILYADWWAGVGPFDDPNTLRRADYLKLRELSVTYDAKGLIPKLGFQDYVQGLSFGFTANNLWTMYHEGFQGLISPETVRNLDRNIPDNTSAGGAIPPYQTLIWFVRVQI